MIFGSVCSGIEAASVAWSPLGWQAAWFAEIEPFPCAVLKHHYPLVRNVGDMTAIAGRIAAGSMVAPDVFCGGTPCQAFSVAGLRNSLADARGNLTLEFVRIANAIDDARIAPGLPESIIFWENVPGVLSTHDNAFGCFLTGLAGEDDALVPPGPKPKPGRPYKWANAGVVYGPRRTVVWRILDAQYFGLAQRRKRVFVVASARADFDPVAVLFEFEGVRRDTAPRRNAGQDAAAGTLRSTDGGSDVGAVTVGALQANSGPNAHGFGDFLSNQAVQAGHILAFGGNDTRGPIEVATALRAKGGTGHGDFESETFIAFDTTQLTHPRNGANPQPGDPCHPLSAGAHPPAICWTGDGEVADPVSANEGSTYTHEGETFRMHNCVSAPVQVRRLTPVECERLQGFEDDYTNVPFKGKPVADGPRYKALGNSWATYVINWIGRRIDAQIA